MLAISSDISARALPAAVGLFSRRVGGSAMKAEITAQLITDTLIMAICPLYQLVLPSGRYC